jgi:hypothetical protein
MKIRQHWYCPVAPLREVKSRNKVKLLRPMGRVKVIYARINGKWTRVGTLCLDCLLFDPTEKQLLIKKAPDIFKNK